MKKTVFTLLGICYALTVTLAQPTDWAKKYWNYRDRIHKYFVHLGTQPGDGLPAAHRPLKRFANFPYQAQTTGSINGLKFGDVIADLGDYIAVLATEYKLLSDAKI